MRRRGDEIDLFAARLGGEAPTDLADIDIHAREILIIRERLNQLMAEHTGQDLATIQLDTERDRFMNAEESREYGLIDEVVTRRSGG